MKSKAKALPKPNIVESYQLGNTTVLIADNEYRDKTPEQINQIWKDFYEVGWEIWNNIAQKNHESINQD